MRFLPPHAAPASTPGCSRFAPLLPFAAVRCCFLLFVRFLTCSCFLWLASQLVVCLKANNDVLLDKAEQRQLFQDDELYDAELIQNIENAANQRMNTDLREKQGRKVAMIDDHHIWAFVLDPYMRAFNLEIPNKAGVINAMARCADPLLIFSFAIVYLQPSALCIGKTT